jgi:outer membrane biogenesis lipoprotein LolB
MPPEARVLQTGLLAGVAVALLLATGCAGDAPRSPTTQTTPAGSSAGQTQAKPSSAR